jgi:hypothetical protein
MSTRQHELLARFPRAGLSLTQRLLPTGCLFGVKAIEPDDTGPVSDLTRHRSPITLTTVAGALQIGWAV